MFNTEKIESIKEILLSRKEKLSVAESVTSGFLQAAISEAALALQFFEGGITTYNINQKVRHLKVDRKHAEECNCVSELTANQMAIGVCNLFGTHWGIATTGYASAVPESGNKLFAFFSISCRGEIKLIQKVDLKDEKPEEAQIKYVNIILEKFLQLLNQE
ncbi:MAG TPA: nicotinamide-nucleotide amidohydrolase family protein [Flavitalea sp.]|nr:nicotinamide-nucleotide amidohydrolase family protein [Flavitalea sp.]